MGVVSLHSLARWRAIDGPALAWGRWGAIDGVGGD